MHELHELSNSIDKVRQQFLLSIIIGCGGFLAWLMGAGIGAAIVGVIFGIFGKTAGDVAGTLTFFALLVVIPILEVRLFLKWRRSKNPPKPAPGTVTAQFVKSGDPNSPWSS